MSAKKKETAQPAPRGYFHESSRPFTSLIFILPLLIAYEGAILALGADAVHNAAAQWLQNVLSAIGFGRYVLLPVLTIGLLLGWHYASRLPWKFSPWVLPAMFVEAIAWGALLWLVYKGWSQLVGRAIDVPYDLAHLFGFFGAGIYEELLFRVLLLSGIALIIHSAGAPRRASLVPVIVISALLFALAHYDVATSGGQPFSWVGVTFHAILGVAFGVLFVLRGFGITAGTHALYNVLVMLLKV